MNMPPENEDSGAKSLVGVLKHDRERDEHDLPVQREEDGDEKEERDERGVEVLHGEGAPGVGEEEAEDREQADCATGLSDEQSVDIIQVLPFENFATMTNTSAHLMALSAAPLPPPSSPSISIDDALFE